MSRIHEKSKLIQVLSETPLVSFACKKVGVSRATFYRWYKDDKDFRDSVIPMLDIGRKNITDLAEQSLIKLLATGNMTAVRFWLQHNDPRYRPVRTSHIEPVVHRHELKPGETCYICGHHEIDHRGTVITAESAFGVTESKKKLSRKELNRAAMEKYVSGDSQATEDELDLIFGRKFEEEDVVEEKPQEVPQKGAYDI